jgi:hypothetical protein
MVVAVGNHISIYSDDAVLEESVEKKKRWRHGICFQEVSLVVFDLALQVKEG